MEKKTEKEIKSWVVFLIVIGTLWITGLHRPIIAQVNRLVLWTGVIKPNTDIADANVKVGTLRFLDEDGTPVDISKFEGKVVFINFWATWCPPCIAEMPGIENLYQSADKGKIQFAIVSLDDDFEKAKSFKEKKGYTFPIYTLASALPAELEAEVLPTTYVLNQFGVIKMKHDGMAKYDSDSFKDYLMTLTK